MCLHSVGKQLVNLLLMAGRAGLGFHVLVEPFSGLDRSWRLVKVALHAAAGLLGKPFLVAGDALAVHGIGKARRFSFDKLGSGRSLARLMAVGTIGRRLFYGRIGMMA